MITASEARKIVDEHSGVKLSELYEDIGIAVRVAAQKGRTRLNVSSEFIHKDELQFAPPTPQTDEHFGITLTPTQQQIVTHFRCSGYGVNIIPTTDKSKSELILNW